MSTLKVDTILKRTGTGTITLGQSGDTIALGSGASQTGFGGVNTPLFSVKCGTFNISNSTMTKIQFDTESGNFFDPSGVFDTSNNRVTPSSTGYYLFGCAVTIKDVGDGKKFQMQLRKNGAAFFTGTGQADYMNTAGVNDNLTTNGTWLVNHTTATDYYEIFCLHNKGSTQETRGDFNNNFWGIKLIS
tara:strand:- start:198 stop:761 length:564 start_codon:yes stop_codon:yes gene_type:complete